MTTIIKAQPTLETTEKIGYALGDLAANLIFQTLLTFSSFRTPSLTPLDLINGLKR